MLKMFFALAALTSLVGSASAQVGPGVSWPPSSRGCASWSIAGACPPPPRAVRLLPRTQRLIREITARRRGGAYAQ
jgi:hypothetical protein